MLPHTALQRAVEGLLGRPERTEGRELSYTCPFCRQSHIHVNYVKGKALCHHCGFKTSYLVNILRALGSADTRAVYRSPLPSQFLRAVEGIVFPEVDVVEQTDSLPASFTPIPLLRTKDAYGRVAYNYLVGLRGITPEQVDAGCFGYCWEGRYAGCIIFPCYMFGRLAYFTSRRFLGVGPKSIHPKAPRQGVLFNVDRAYEAQRLLVVEGPISCLKAEQAGYSAVALMGHSIDNRQARVIARFPNLENVVVVLDPDVPERECFLVASRLSKETSLPVRYVRLEGGDPAELTPEELRVQVDSSMLLGLDKEVRLILGM